MKVMVGNTPIDDYRIAFHYSVKPAERSHERVEGIQFHAVLGKVLPLVVTESRGLGPSWKFSQYYMEGEST